METDSFGRLLAPTAAALPAFALFRPDSVAAALEAFAGDAAGACFYAGGTDFFARVREGAAPARLIWVDGLAELRRVERDAESLTLGALLTHESAWRNAALDAVPGLAAAWRSIATQRIRRQATLGGNLMARRTRYELSILLTALDATALLAGSDARGELPVSALWDADLGARPLLTGVRIALSGAPRLHYERAMRPTFTQAACVRDEADGGRRLRFVMATEHLRPWFRDVPIPKVLDTEAAQALAAETTARLPAEFHDPAAGRDYLARAGTAYLARQLSALGEVA